MLAYLEKDLIINIKNAKSLSIAVALINNYGLKIVEENVPKNCHREYLIGIHLPTPPDVLRKLLELGNDFSNKVETRLYNSQENYHPKVYLIEKESGDLIAFVGSANATRGGLRHNIEMSVSITDQSQCLMLKDWFNQLFLKSKKYDEEFVKQYEYVYRKNRSLSSTQKSNIEKIVGSSNSSVSQKITIRTGQFFRQSDFDAFAVPLQMDKSTFAVELRANVKERLIELSEMIVPKFIDYGMTDLHQPYKRNLYTSQHFHSGRSLGPKEAIWLHFGKSRVELVKYEGDFQSITNHARLQVILRNTATEIYIGIWLYLSKPGGSYFDKERLVEGLKDINFRERLYEYIIDLGGVYWVAVGDDWLNVSEIKSSDELADFLVEDIYQYEIIIGRNYDPNDLSLSEENIEETVLVEFSKLFKIYALIKAPPL